MNGEGLKVEDYTCKQNIKYSHSECFIPPIYIGIQQYKKNERRRIQYSLHTYVRTRYKPKILHA